MSAESQVARRTIPDRLDTRLGRWVRSWEALLLLVLVLICAANSLASPYFLDPWNLSDATFNFTEKGIIALAMGLLIIAGEIDLSVAAIIALASTAMGAAAQAGVGPAGLCAIGLLVGLSCGAFHGFLITRVSLPSIVAPIRNITL